MRKRLQYVLRAIMGIREPAPAPPPDLPDARRVTADDIEGFATFVCDAYRIDGPVSAKSVVDFIAAKGPSHPDEQLFATLDDFEQASYTSGHVADKLRLDDLEKPTYADRRERFFERLMEVRPEPRPPVAAGSLTWRDAGPDEPHPSVVSTRDVDLDGPVYVCIVPTRAAAEGITAFPNGYFADDLGPHEVLSLANMVAPTFGYSLFGIGARYVGFRRTSTGVLPLKAFGAYLETLYRYEDDEERLRVRYAIGRGLTGERSFLFRYTE